MYCNVLLARLPSSALWPLSVPLSLQYLDLQRNLLVRLPVGLAALSRLADLDLSSNSLLRLPPDFGQLMGYGGGMWSGMEELWGDKS